MKDRPCPVCKQNVTRNKRGEVLMHTTEGRAGVPPEICRGATKGARP